MELKEHLRKIPLFSGLGDEHLDLLASQFKPQHFHSSEDLVGQGELGSRFFIVDRGHVNQSASDVNGFEKSLGVVPTPTVAGSTVPPQTFFGEQMFTSQEPFEYRAYAITDVDTFVMERGDFDAVLLAHPHLRHAMPFIAEAEKKRTRGFEWVEEGEIVAEVFHKHWWSFLPSVITFLVGMGMAIGAHLILGAIHLDVGYWVIGGGWLVMLAYLGFMIYDWRNDDYIVTNQRVAHVERQFIAIELTEAVPFDKIIGAKIERSGLAGILGVCDVVIQTAGRQEGNVSFERVGNGPAIVKLIETQRGRVRALRAADLRERERKRIQGKLRGYILPHIVAKEVAERAVQAPPPLPHKQPSIFQRLGQLVHYIFDYEEKHDVVVIWRKHWIVLLRQGWRWIVYLVVLDGLFALFALVPGLQILPAGGYILGGLVALIVGLVGMWWEWEDWRNDTYAVTATQVVDAERLPLGLREKSITAQLDQVQDVRVIVEGILPAFLGYGDLHIETAGQGSQMIFKSIRHPREAAEQIFQHIEGLRQRVVERDTDIRDRATIDALIAYDRIRKEEQRHLNNAEVAPAPPPPPEPEPEENQDENAKSEEP